MVLSAFLCRFRKYCTESNKPSIVLDVVYWGGASVDIVNCVIAFSKPRLPKIEKRL